MAPKAKLAPAKSSPAEQAGEPEVEKLQRELKRQGYYAGEIDGRMGKDTQDAVRRRDEAASSKNNVTVSENNRAAKEAENDPVARVTKTATEVAPYVAGVAAGTMVGHKGFGQPFARQDAEKRASAKRIAQSAEIDPIAKEHQLGQMNRNRLLRNTSQFGAPAMLLGAGYGTREFIAPQFSDPQMRDIINAVGTGENAAGLTLGVHQMVETLRRGNPIADEDQARIRSDAMRARQPAAPAVAAPPTPAPAPLPQPVPAQSPTRHSLRLGNAVTAAGGAASTSKQANYAALAKSLTAENMPAVAEALNLPQGADKRSILQRARELVNTRGASSYFLPIAAGTMAASAAYGDAEASERNGAPDNAIERAAAAGGAAAGTVYGANRLLRRLPSAVGQAFSMAGDVSAPAMIDAMTDYSPDEIAQGRNWIARNIPAARHLGGGFQQGYEMAQVPEPGARSPEAMQARSQVDARTPDNDFDLALEDLRALLAASGAGEDEGMMPPDVAPQPMQVSPMAYYPPAMAADNRLLRRF